MKSPGFNHTLAWFGCGAASLTLALTIRAEPPETASKKGAASWGQPQVIYHLPPSSNYAATLHSQAKGQNNELPIDDRMPTSLQMSRANANAAAAQARQEAVATPTPEQRIKRTRPSSNRSARPQS